MLIDQIMIMKQQNGAAAWPHILGIFSGHIFHFFTKVNAQPCRLRFGHVSEALSFKVWPALGGRAYLDTPKWFINRFGGPPISNVDGFGGQERSTKKKKFKTTGKGRVLSAGSSSS
jgi:hypothetical protein